MGHLTIHWLTHHLTSHSPSTTLLAPFAALPEEVVAFPRGLRSTQLGLKMGVRKDTTED